MERLPAIGRMISAALLVIAGGAADAQSRPGNGEEGVVVSGQITVRVRTRPPAPDPRIEWREKRGPKCIPASSIAAAALVRRDRVDIILRDNRRLRVRLESSCPALDFYSGFYLKPNPDGRICADRDVIRSRMGGQCGIDTFRTLEPVERD